MLRQATIARSAIVACICNNGSSHDGTNDTSTVAAPGRQGSQVISRSLRSRGRSSGANASAVKEPFRGQKILKPGHRVHFFTKKKLTTFLVVALKTQAANSADCFTDKIKQIKRSDVVTFSKFSVHTITEAKQIGMADLPARSFDLTRRDVAPPLVDASVHCCNSSTTSSTNSNAGWNFTTSSIILICFNQHLILF